MVASHFPLTRREPLAYAYNDFKSSIRFVGLGHGVASISVIDADREHQPRARTEIPDAQVVSKRPGIRDKPAVSGLCGL